MAELESSLISERVTAVTAPHPGAVSCFLGFAHALSWRLRHGTLPDRETPAGYGSGESVLADGRNEASIQRKAIPRGPVEPGTSPIACEIG
jgi:hypothetical protein